MLVPPTNVVTVIFYEMLHDFLEDYVDDIVMKSKEVCYHVDDLREKSSPYASGIICR